MRDLEKVARGLKMVNVMESLESAKVRLKEADYECNMYNPE